METFIIVALLHSEQWGSKGSECWRLITSLCSGGCFRAGKLSQARSFFPAGNVAQLLCTAVISGVPSYTAIIFKQFLSHTSLPWEDEEKSISSYSVKTVTCFLLLLIKIYSMFCDTKPCTASSCDYIYELGILVIISGSLPPSFTAPPPRRFKTEKILFYIWTWDKTSTNCFQ